MDIGEQGLRMDEMPDKKRGFLRSLNLFENFSEEQIKDIAATMEWQYFTPGQPIVADENRGSAFYLIKRGLVRVHCQSERKEVILDYLGQGDFFGDMAILSDVDINTCVVAAESTMCLVQDKGPFQEMITNNPGLYSFFTNMLMRRMKNLSKEFLADMPGTSCIEPFLYRKQVKDLLEGPPVYCNENDSIEHAARDLMEKKVSTLIVLDEKRTTVGLIGLRELTKACAIEGMDRTGSIRPIIKRSYFTIKGSNYIFDAIYDMMTHRTSKLVVTHKGRPRGIITGFDLLRFRGRDVLSLIRNIESASDLTMVDRQRQDVEKVLRVLIADGAQASHTCKVISALNDKISRKVISFVETELGKPPVSYAWLGLGSEGRKEQTLLTDQDNGIIFSSDSAGATDYFRDLSEKVVDGLKRCGFPICKGNIMAINQKYHGTLDSWKKRAEKWISSQNQDGNLVDMYVFLDFRTIYGDQELEKTLRHHILKCISRDNSFLEHLSDSITSIPIPLNLFKTFVVEKKGEHRNSINFKNYGLLPFTTCLKILAFYYRLEETNTLERLEELEKKEVFLPEDAELYKGAFETFLALKIKNDLANRDEGRPFKNYINPESLPYHQRQSLKSAFLATAQLQKMTRNTLMAGSKNALWKRAEVSKSY